MFKKVKKFELRGRIYVVVATERFEIMDILRGQNYESVKFLRSGEVSRIQTE